MSALSERSTTARAPSLLGSHRRSRKADYVRGKSAGSSAREQVATLRPPKERRAMGRVARRRLESEGWVSRPFWSASHRCADCIVGRESAEQKEHEDGGESDEDEEDGTPQYTLESRVRSAKSSLPCLELRQKVGCCCSRTTLTFEEKHSDGKPSYCLFVDVNRIISNYLSWTYRTSYCFLFTVFAMIYFSQILIFALIFYAISSYYPQCINSNGEMIGHGEYARIFGDAFQLSWTTFSTVGYGIIFPATGASVFDVPTGCVGLGIIGSFEAFLGVLYAGFCGAILFGKVLRSQNNAQIFFSDPIVVRFGKEELSGGNSIGVTTSAPNSPRPVTVQVVNETKEEHDEEMGGDGGAASLYADAGIPCPSLEFRLVNRLHDVPQGEIVEAKLDCVAILDPELSQMHKTSTAFNIGSVAAAAQLKVNETTTIAELAKVLREANKPTRSLAFHSSDSKQPHMFTKITLDADEHPYFRRVWFGRHRLDENSPLLTPAARRRVKLNGGAWPADMNNYQTIKRSLCFRHILVSMSGTSNANAASVYAQKVYDLVDVNVGYRFVPMIYHTDEGTLKTDSYLLNAVYQQRGGGAEPF